MPTRVTLGLRRVPGIDPEMDLSGSGTCLAWYEVRPSKARGTKRVACRGEPMCSPGSYVRRRYETSRLDSPR